jgi:hypothetical protein
MQARETPSSVYLGEDERDLRGMRHYIEWLISQEPSMLIDHRLK